MLRLARAPSEAEIRVIGALFLIGAAAGFVYWLIAGRTAGLTARVPSSPRDTPPT